MKRNLFLYKCHVRIMQETLTISVIKTDQLMLYMAKVTVCLSYILNINTM